MYSRLVVLALICLPLLFAAPASAEPPIAHSATTCSDYSNQAAAQHAADTRDSDGDGLYCEDLPCPCAGPGSSSPAPRHHARKPKPRRKPALFAGPCKRGRLPDKSCSPGKVGSTDLNEICTEGYSERVRDVTERTKNRIYREYGIRRHSTGQYEIDHIIPLELGGSNSIKNLYPEAARPVPGFHQKDVLENTLHSMACNDEMALADAQAMIANNWVKAWRTFVMDANY